MNASDFEFDLPEELIAQVPAARRSGSRLLHVPPEGALRHLEFEDFPSLLRPGDRLVLNETRVIPARLAVRRESGGAIEVFLVREEGDGAWRALVRPAKRLRPGDRLRGAEGDWSIVVRSIDGGEAVVEFPSDAPAADVLRRHGDVPLPPYVRRAPTSDDRERYQTVFARVPGAVAAPTAGLHFDEATLAAVAAAGVEVSRLVLHVGPGTFRPLPDDVDLEEHMLDEESWSVPTDVLEAVAATRRAGGRIIAVGTTVVRALESAVRAGGATSGRTRLFVKPPFEFRAVDALLTNFHLPRSSLLCLVSALVGRDRILDAYREAVAARYRFYSYGDATFLEPPRAAATREESSQ